MNTRQKKLRITQLDRKIKVFASLQDAATPAGGWINAVRTTLGMSLKQLGNKLGISPQAAKDIERRESNGSITLSALKEAAAALDMQLVYGLIPRDETLENMIERRARELALRIVQRTSHTMHLEGQAVSKDELKRAVEMKTQEIINEMPKYLWD
jgi:predicted DNA-binding mobile mystery protein A